MSILNKYKSSLYIDMKESLNLCKNFKIDINYIFNYKKKLIRNFLFFLCIIFLLKPFSTYNFFTKPIFFLSIEIDVLFIIDSNSINNFYSF